MPSASQDAKKVCESAQEIRLLVLASQQALTQDAKLCGELLLQLYSKVDSSVKSCDKLFTKIRNLEIDHNRQRKLVEAKVQTINCLRKQLAGTSPASGMSPIVGSPPSVLSSQQRLPAKSSSCIVRPSTISATPGCVAQSVENKSTSSSRITSAGKPTGLCNGLATTTPRFGNANLPRGVSKVTGLDSENSSYAAKRKLDFIGKPGGESWKVLS